MSSHIITAKLVGADEDAGIVRFEDFTEFCENLGKCLRKSEALISDRSPRIQYRIKALQTASATITLEALPTLNGDDYGGQTLTLFTDTVVNLQRGGRVDPRIDRKALEVFRGLVTPLRRHTKEVWVDESRLTIQYEANIESILGTSIASDGCVSGVLERLNVHNISREFMLYPPIPGYRIRCIFPGEMLEQVRVAIKRNVTVCGKLYYQEDRPFPDLVHVQNMELHPPDDELPTLVSLKGIAPKCTNGMDSVTFVRSMRDEP